MATEEITSLQNPRIREITKLQQKPAFRRESGLILTEGIREVSMALQSGLIPQSIFLCDNIFQPSAHYPISLEKFEKQLVRVSTQVYKKMAYRADAEGIIAVFPVFDTSIQRLNRVINPLLIVLESVEKPGNLGAVLRTADGAGASGVIVCDPATDVFNPNVIRASLGSCFSVPLVVCTSKEYFSWAEAHHVKTVVASLQAHKMYYEVDLKKPVAIAFGAEATGLSGFWYQQSHEKIIIPMRGKTDSLNVSASVAVIAYEALRQRSVG